MILAVYATAAAAAAAALHSAVEVEAEVGDVAAVRLVVHKPQRVQLLLMEMQRPLVALDVRSHPALVHRCLNGVHLLGVGHEAAVDQLRLQVEEAGL